MKRRTAKKVMEGLSYIRNHTGEMFENKPLNRKQRRAVAAAQRQHKSVKLIGWSI